MPEIDFSKLIEAASNPSTGANLEKATTFAETTKKTLDAAEGWLNLIDRVVKVAERTGTLPGLMRVVGKQYGVDVDSPLKTSNAVEPTSEVHRIVYSGLNQLSPEEAAEAGQVIDNWYRSKKHARVAGNDEAEASKSEPGTA